MAEIIDSSATFLRPQNSLAPTSRLMGLNETWRKSMFDIGANYEKLLLVAMANLFFFYEE